MDRYEEIAKELEASEDYRILRRLQTGERYSDGPSDPASIHKGVYIDVETTGLNYAEDEVIELAMIPFRFTSEGKLIDLGPAFDQLQEPQNPIASEITALTGITNELVKGTQIDAGAVQDIVSSVDLVVAHNAGFDRKFVEASWPIFEKKAWGCSQRGVPWGNEGIAGSKLEYIAAHYGFFYDAHRAETDCRAGLEILSRDLPVSKEGVLKIILDNTKKLVFRVHATNAPFESKDILKGRGYRWNGGTNGQPKAWFIDCSESEQIIELEYLKAIIYKRSNVSIPVRCITAFDRFSVRA